MPRISRLAIGIVIGFALCTSSAFAAQTSTDPLSAAIASPARTPANVARDRYRHPLETLRFFGIQPDATVVEIWPGGGWYMEILAPYLHDHGRYYAALDAPRASAPADDEEKTLAARLRKKLADDPGRYGKVTVTEFHPPERSEICPPGTADLVLTFRNVHNFIENGNQQAMFEAFFKALKPGGVLGVVEHRARPGTTPEQSIKTGYVDEALVKKLATAAGFRFDAESAVNDNPKDTKDYPEGVWTLPPTLALKDKDRARYLEIGESDRMTLRFVKP